MLPLRAEAAMTLPPMTPSEGETAVRLRSHAPAVRAVVRRGAWPGAAGTE